MRAPRPPGMGRRKPAPLPWNLPHTNPAVPSRDPRRPQRPSEPGAVGTVVLSAEPRAPSFPPPFRPQLPLILPCSRGFSPHTVFKASLSLRREKSPSLALTARSESTLVLRVYIDFPLYTIKVETLKITKAGGRSAWHAISTPRDRAREGGAGLGPRDPSPSPRSPGVKAMRSLKGTRGVWVGKWGCSSGVGVPVPAC